ncbi:hypothetical protein OG884_07575 [Streptosporangium sp. NBC_01755]|uniref:hypothetical protein n=1 Tax=Streptosporangium sp. NBC_01755 TaxID=2975949 RepID=UPI002DD9BA41|nr:hypothetical protein [Streptosporangium sp. NBC_01755]WSD01772.1 hypothetical protein OG884_07575 [Streptosporangium sp. NBC_01755]
MGRFVRRGVLVCTVVLLGVAGCGDSGPTAAEAGETLKTHITELMKERHALDVRITDSGGRDISCGEGKEKRTFAAVGRDPATERGADSLNTLLLGSLSGVAPYRIVEDRGDAPIKLANDEYKTKMTLESPGNGQYAVRGETECLPTS